MIQVVELLEARVSRLVDEVEALRIAKNQLESENDGLKITVADYDQMKAELDEVRAASAAQAESLAQLEDLREQVNAVAAERDVALLEKDEVLGKLEEALARVAEIQEAMNEAFAQRDEYAAELAASKTRIAELEGERQGVARHREEANKQIAEARAEIDELWTELQTVTEERDALRQNAGAAEQVARERDEWRGRYEAAQAAAENAIALEKELDSVRGQKQSLEERLRDAERRDGLMRDRLNRLIERIESAESFLAQVELIHENA